VGLENWVQDHELRILEIEIDHHAGWQQGQDGRATTL